MDYPLSKIVGLFSTASTPLLLALLVSLALLWTRRHWRTGRMILSVTLFCLAAIIVTPLQTWLTATLEDRLPARPSLPEKIDGIIILGGMIRPGVSTARGMPSVNDAAQRLWEGAELARQHPEAKLLFTGGSADPWNKAASEAAFAGQALREMGVAPEQMILEDRSRNTFENAVYSKLLAAPQPGQSWVLVTSALHMPRAVAVFRHAGWQVIPWPVNYLTGGRLDWVNEDMPLQRLYNFSRTLHEYVGLVYYRLRGWTDIILP